MSLLVPIIVAVIIALQIFFFVKNVLRMREYKKIFAEEKSWGIAHNPETKFVSGIYTTGWPIIDGASTDTQPRRREIIDRPLKSDTPIERETSSVPSANISEIITQNADKLLSHSQQCSQSHLLRATNSKS